MKPALALLLFLAAHAASAASFDCAKAGTRVEKLVCADPELGALDERLAAAFSALGIENTGNEWGRHAPRSDDQRRWLREVRDRCRDAACLREAYAARIAVLEAWHEPAPADASIAGRYVVDTVTAFVMGPDAPMEKAPTQDCLSVLPRADGDFDVVVDSMQTNGHTCWVEGRFRADGDVLRRLPEADDPDPPDPDAAACAIALRVERGELRTDAPSPSCSIGWCGARAHLDGLAFPRSTREAGAASACPGIDR